MAALRCWWITNNCKEVKSSGLLTDGVKPSERFVINMSHQVIASKVNSKLNQVRYFTTCGADLNVTALPCWMRLCVRESETKGVPSDYETHPLPKLLVCFHGEVESALKKRLHPIIRDGGRSAWHGSDDEPYSPCSSFPWQWLNEILVMEGWAQTGRRVTSLFFSLLPQCLTCICHSHQTIKQLS